ncbi:MAG: hypothetical protein QOC67_4994 [Pseudonocardiales bacterium]|jgi:hypothetical protein|nr:hypothetical protein [Pseudonocardiales bacterium]MDT7586668.1 hypothetical protein [Pseudonocardiales bacterium]MDT7625162.1 hypothetical protein [Pseudonocardiales bacterium]MDT7641363.1 hypothetical protein [Pseudonocardiales bacterium]MDT7673187.1 hypothetical protein [Pseudonocardiales bacterium]
MTSSVLMVIVFALLVYGVERNHYRQLRRQPPRRRELIGSTDVEDRDLARLEAELWALPEAPVPAPRHHAAPDLSWRAGLPHVVRGDR